LATVAFVEQVIKADSFKQRRESWVRVKFADKSACKTYNYVAGLRYAR